MRGWNSRNKGRVKEIEKRTRLKNKDKISARHKLYYQHNKQRWSAYGKARWGAKSIEEKRLIALKNKEGKEDKIKTYSLLYYQRNKETIKSKVAVWCKANHDRLLDRMRRYNKERRQRDINYRLICCLRKRITGCLARYRSGIAVNHQHARELIGCSMEELKKHLEHRFIPGMSWENYGVKGWHMDHIVPCCQFNMLDPFQVKQCFHYTNMQPLWAIDNIRKNGRLVA